MEQYSADGWVKRIKLEQEAGKRRIASAGTVHKHADHFRTLGLWEGQKEKGAWIHRVVQDPADNEIPLPAPEELTHLINSPGGSGRASRSRR